MLKRKLALCFSRKGLLVAARMRCMRFIVPDGAVH
jgi:hypothetical protein